MRLILSVAVALLCGCQSALVARVESEARIVAAFDGRYLAVEASGPWIASVEDSAGTVLLSAGDPGGPVVFVADAREKQRARVAPGDTPPAWAAAILTKLGDVE